MHRNNRGSQTAFRLLLLLVLVTGSVSTRAQTPGDSRISESNAGNVARSEIMAHMARLRSAILNRDSLELQTLLAADVTYGHSNGLNQTKAQMIRSVMSGQHDYRKIQPRNLDIRVFEETAIVTMEADVSMVLEGKPLDMDMDILLVWVRSNGAWHLIARQSARNG